MIRRLLGVLIAASMAHLVFEGSDLVCATHGGHAAAHGAKAMTNMHHHGNAGDTGNERCKVPARSDCCEAMTSCSANAALASMMPGQSRLNHEARLVAYLADAPLSRVLPPEPPPPKS